MAKWYQKNSTSAIKKKVIAGVAPKLIAIGLQMESDIKRSMSKRGSAPMEPPGIRTGRLRASISTNWTGSGMEYGKTNGLCAESDGVPQPESSGEDFHVYIGTSVPYARHLEYGTVKMAPRPFLRPVVDLYKSRFKELLASGSVRTFLK